MTDVSRIKGVRRVGESSSKIVVPSISCRSPLNIKELKTKKKRGKK